MRKMLFLLLLDLGDSHLERRTEAGGTRIIFEQSNKNVEYLKWFHNFLAQRGYCNPQVPALKTRITKLGVLHFIRVCSYTFSSLNWLHSLFYIIGPAGNYVKVISPDLVKYLTPLALAVWFMDDGSAERTGLRIATNGFSYSENELLCKILMAKYNIKATVISYGPGKGFVIRIWKESVQDYIDIVRPHMLPSMLYKFKL
uniref:LAGLIDADG endonuclease n=1 Tax=Powellomyces hirtus TaxID=109895 RepID=A0A4P8NPE2_9FUNG|nr:LAGLIDADG endonuclease [Powellomyces hirtus]